MTKEQIYNAISDMAEDAGISTESLISALMNENEAIFERSLGDLNDAATHYVRAARAEKAARRESERQAERDNALSAEIKRFCTVFPGVDAESIPESVWADVERGIPLAYAYALFAAENSGGNAYAEEVNERNSKYAVPAFVEGADEGEISMDEVDGMSASAVKKNFPRILRSISKWKIQ